MQKEKYDIGFYYIYIYIYISKKTLLPVSQHYVSPGHSLDDLGRSKMYIIDHNPSWKENERKKESFWISELQTLHRDVYVYIYVYIYIYILYYILELDFFSY